MVFIESHNFVANTLILIQRRRIKWNRKKDLVRCFRSSFEKLTLSDCSCESKDPFARKFAALFQLFRGRPPEALRMLASMTTLFKRFYIGEKPETTPL